MAINKKYQHSYAGVISEGVPPGDAAASTGWHVRSGSGFLLTQDEIASFAGDLLPLARPTQGGVERSPGPAAGTTVVADHVEQQSRLRAFLDGLPALRDGRARQLEGHLVDPAEGRVVQERDQCHHDGVDVVRDPSRLYDERLRGLVAGRGGLVTGVDQRSVERIGELRPTAADHLAFLVADAEEIHVDDRFGLRLRLRCGTAEHPGQEPAPGRLRYGLLLTLLGGDDVAEQNLELRGQVAVGVDERRGLREIEHLVCFLIYNGRFLDGSDLHINTISF